MSSQFKKPANQPRPKVEGNHNKNLNNMLNFGPDNTTPENEANDRIRQLVKKLQEINRRIDRLASHF